jgi:D-alanyl-D-alanine carboxypeptidase/D-alanyl-D-alanine-endopeptidase (penicillin-binding protein 4)
MRRGLMPTLLAVLVLAGVAPASAAPLDALVARHLSSAGGISGGYVLDTTTGRTLASINADVPRIPASVNKLFPTSTALLRFGPRATLATTVLGAGSLDDAGTWHGDLYLRGGGDPTFGTMTFARRAYGGGAAVGDLAKALRGAGIRRVTGGVYGDETWFDRLRGGPSTGYAFDIWIGGPLGSLMFNRGLAREDGSAVQLRPAKFAARQLALALRRKRVRVDLLRVGERQTPADAQELATVASPSIATLVRLTLAPSDNLLAEMLLKTLGARFGATGSTAAGGAVVRTTLGRFAVRPAIADGSGLSRSNRTTPRQVVLLLDRMRELPELRAGLAIAGRTGTLEDRMRHSSAQDRCQAKTGTLSNVSALAGYCRTPNGHLIAFAFLHNYVYTPLARIAQDRLAIALARLRPGGQPPPVEPPPAPPADPPASPEPPPTATTGGAAPASSASSPASSSTGTASRSAFSSLDPALSPATT